MEDLLAARTQMAVSLMFHIVFAIAGMAMPVLMVVSEFLWLRTREPHYLELTRQDFRRRALASGLLLGVVAAVLGAAGLDAPELLHDLTRTRWSWLLHAVTAVSALATLFALWARRFRLARAGAVVQVSLIVWGWAFSQYPHLVKPDLTVEAAAAPPVTLKLMLWALAGGTVVLLPSFVYLFRVFGKVRGPATSPGK